MIYTEFDSDNILTRFLTDYIDGNLSHGERASFEEYLADNDKEREFARKAALGKKTLRRFAEKIKLPSLKV